MLTQNHIVGGSAEERNQNEALRLIDGGTLRINVCPSSVAGVGALALHFPQHRLAMFAFPMRLNEEVLTYRDVSPSELTERVVHDFGISIDVPLSSD